MSAFCTNLRLYNDCIVSQAIQLRIPPFLCIFSDNFNNFFSLAPFFCESIAVDAILQRIGTVLVRFTLVYLRFSSASAPFYCGSTAFLLRFTASSLRLYAGI